MELTRNELKQYSLARLFETLAHNKPKLGFEIEVARAAAEASGRPFDVAQPIVPWQVLSRDLTAASASGGGYLVATDVPSPDEPPLHWSVTRRAGVTVLSGLTANEAIPRESAGSTGYWLSGEGAAITSADPSVGQVPLTPKTGGALVNFSRALNTQAPSLDAYLRGVLLRAVGKLVDAAALNGSGAAGQPTGLINTAGIATQSGANLAWSGVVNMLERSASADADDGRIAYIAHPGVRELLQTREKAAGSGFIWGDAGLAGKPGHVTTQAPPATMIVGDWSRLVIGFFGAGPEIAVDPYTGFATRKIAMRVMVSMDVAVTAPAVFCVATSIT